MDVLTLASIITFICAVFSYINNRFLKLPPSIGLMLIALVCSILLIIEGKTSSTFHAYIEPVIKEIDFSKTLLEVMLSFLLFAGSLHVSTKRMKEQRLAITAFSTLGVAMSTLLFGTIIFYVFQLFNHQVSFVYCLLFGALVSPTDPIAVLGILKSTNIPKELEIVISGESLFNDGMGVVFFLTISEVIEKGLENLSGLQVLLLFGREVAGGIILGITLGYLAYYVIKKIDHYQTEVLVSLALVMCCDEIAHLLHVSGPLAVVVTGLIIGNKVSQKVMSSTSRDYHNKFWELIDEFLNAALFVLIGLQLVILPFLYDYIIIGLIAIVTLLFCRWLSISIPITFLKNKVLYNRRSAAIITWGGLRGGLSIALALSLPHSEYKEMIIAITYIIVIFSILVQGLTTEKLVKKIYS